MTRPQLGITQEKQTAQRVHIRQTYTETVRSLAIAELFSIILDRQI